MLPAMYKLVLQPRFPFIASAVICLALVGGGLILASLLNLAACPLCIIQRMLYLLLALVSIAGIAMNRNSIARRLLALDMALIAAVGIFVAGYQVWIQRFARETNCSADAPWWEKLVDWAGEKLPLLFQANGMCSDPAWKFLTLSIAEWSLLAFSTLLVLALIALFRKTPAS